MNTRQLGRERCDDGTLCQLNGAVRVKSDRVNFIVHVPPFQLHPSGTHTAASYIRLRYVTKNLAPSSQARSRFDCNAALLIRVVAADCVLLLPVVTVPRYFQMSRLRVHPASP